MMLCMQRAAVARPRMLHSSQMLFERAATTNAVEKLPLQALIFDVRVAFKRRDENTADEQTGRFLKPSVALDMKVQAMNLRELREELVMRGRLDPYKTNALVGHEMREMLQEEINKEEAKKKQEADKKLEAISTPALGGVRQKYMAKLAAKKAQAARNWDHEQGGKQEPRGSLRIAQVKEPKEQAKKASTASVGILPAKPPDKGDMSQFPYQFRNNGISHLIKYLETRFMKWAFVMQPDMKAEDIYDFQSINDNLDRKQLTATRPLDAEVPELRALLQQTAECMGIHRHCIMVISDDEKMLTAAARNDMIPCAFEPTERFQKYYSHRVENCVVVQTEVESWNGVSLNATFNGTGTIFSSTVTQ